MYALLPEDLRALANLIEKLDSGVLGVDGMYVGTVPIRDADGKTILGTIEYDDHGSYGFIYNTEKDEDEQSDS